MLTCNKLNNFLDWIPDNVKSELCTVPPFNIDRAATLIANTTEISKPLLRIQQQFHMMFRRKAFLHALCGEGMDEMEFAEAEQNLIDLIAEYR